MSRNLSPILAQRTSTGTRTSLVCGNLLLPSAESQTPASARCSWCVLDLSYLGKNLGTRCVLFLKLGALLHQREDALFPSYFITMTVPLPSSPSHILLLGRPTPAPNRVITSSEWHEPFVLTGFVSFVNHNREGTIPDIW